VTALLRHQSFRLRSPWRDDHGALAGQHRSAEEEKVVLARQLQDLRRVHVTLEETHAQIKSQLGGAEEAHVALQEKSKRDLAELQQSHDRFVADAKEETAAIETARSELAQKLVVGAASGAERLVVLRS
jgi:chromosome segregation ATPase